MATIIQLFAKQLSPPMIKLFDQRDPTTSAWSKYLDQKLPFVHVYHGEFGDLAQEMDAMVVSTSSTGSIPKEFVDYFGDPILERRLRSIIRSRCSGKLLIGQAVLIATNNRQFPYLICTPFVRSDGIHGNEPTNAYVATRAILELWRFGRHKRRVIRRLVKSIAIPFFSPETRGFSLDMVAREQMRALEEFFAVCTASQRRHPHLSLVPDLSKA